MAGLPVAERVRPVVSRTPIDLLIVQPAIPRGRRWGYGFQAPNLHLIASFVDRLPADQLQGAHAVVLPENLLTSPVDARPNLEAALQRWVDRLGKPVITGLAMGAREDRGEYRSAAVWLEPEAGIVSRVDKERAVPVVESNRAIVGQSVLARLFGGAANWSKVEESRRSFGSLEGSFAVTPVLCYEALFPDIVAARRVPGSVAILNLADDDWVSGDAATYQLTTFATFRAIEQRLNLVRLAHGGLSVAIDEFGRTLESMPLDRHAAERVSVRSSPPVTPSESASLLALPFVGVAGVWWITGFVTRNRRT